MIKREKSRTGGKEQQKKERFKQQRKKGSEFRL